ncbi:MAG: hypothetical protein GY739_02255 [Mesoflavibacter sp.]|jgi:hypothetical protein|nr:hypothetical protein [Mesoflavibacter sp.]|tara:strand:+ start:26 stop:307 length:282 start_codon:yes stop_codon:yes gene_type:complete
MQIPITYTRKLIHETVYLLLLIPLIGHAEEGTFGFAANVSVSGFFSPEISELDIIKVYADSVADLAGLKVGEKVIELDSCTIPGRLLRLQKNR